MPPLIPQISDSIGIVTAFFDIGRGGWTADKGLPPYLHRPVDIYFERFAHLAALDNPMVVYTSPDLAPRVREIRRGKEDRTRVVEVPFAALFGDMRAAIARVQNDPAYINQVNPEQKRNPEYWSPDYVLVNALKSTFVTDAIRNNLIATEMVAWVDFGYCRGPQALGKLRVWQYPFARDKIHLFSYGPYLGNISVAFIIYNNVICVTGAIIVARRDLWPELARLIDRGFHHLLENNLVDDDQTLLLLASLYRPELFEMHTITEAEWPAMLRKFGGE